MDAWYQRSWVDNNNYYVGHDGLWVKNVKKTGWIQKWKFDGTNITAKAKWKEMRVGGLLQELMDAWQQNSWVDNNNYYVGSNGVWVRNAQKTGLDTKWKYIYQL